MKQTQLFDEWPETYDRWFTTSIGSLVKHYETKLILDFLKPGSGEFILDAGCGTGIFTSDIRAAGSRVIGLDLSLPMLRYGKKKAGRVPCEVVVGDVLALPFPGEVFDKVVSITALEFVANARSAVDELFRVTRRGGCVLVATLNSLSPPGRLEEKKRPGKGTGYLRRCFSGLLTRCFPLVRWAESQKPPSTFKNTMIRGSPLRLSPKDAGRV